MANKEITIILPSAGEGSRLGLQTPKELFEIFPGIRLMDFSLAHIRAASQKQDITISTAIVIRPWKTAVIEYAAGQLPGIRVKTVLFNDTYKEWPGSIYSARDTFSKNNLVLLPDAYLSLAKNQGHNNPAITNPHGKTLVELVLNGLTRFQVVFGYIKCTDTNILATLGAVRVEKGIITAFQDKPRPLENPGQYNGFWGCLAFRKEAGEYLYEFLTRSIDRLPQTPSTRTIFPFGVIPISEYYDLGTWENIEGYKQTIFGTGKRES